MEPTVIYDGGCGFCSWSVRFARTKVAPDLIYLPSSTVHLADYGIAEEDCKRALQFISADNKIYSADRAVAQILKHGSPFYSFFGFLLVMPGLNLIAKYGYRLVARYRSRLPGSANSCTLD